MTINMWFATCAWLILVVGYSQRRHRERHIPLMLIGISIDIALVLYLQFTRGAIQTAVSFSLSLFRQLHVLASTGAFALYFPVLYSGWRLASGEVTPGLRDRHVRVANIAMLFRTLGFLLMFSMWHAPVSE